MNAAPNTNTKRSYFDTREFWVSHGRQPRGWGSWAFKPAGAPDDAYVFSPAMTYSDAKKWVVAQHGHNDYVVGP